MATSRERLLMTANEEDFSGFLDILGEQSSRRPLVNMAEIITELSQKQRMTIWTKMNHIVEKLISDIETTGFTENVVKNNSLKMLQCITSVIISVVKTEVCHADDILPLCRALFDVLKIVESKDTNLCNQIYKLYEVWWTKQLGGREEFASQTLFFWLQTSLRKSAKGDVKRVYSMRECLVGVSLNNKEMELLLQCVTSSVFLRVDEGRKFIAFVMLLSRKILNMAHDEIKLKLTRCDSSEVNYYGEIYARAWNSSSNEGLKLNVELDCIQDLMHHCVYASSIPLASALLKVLGHLHNQKRQHEVGKMLVRLYGPILWRALKVVNSSVRYNAAMILFNAFPLEDPDLNRVDLDAEIQKQLDLIEELLYDPSPSVRCVAVMGVCHICSVYWEMIPNNVIKSLLMNLVENLAFDSSSAKVRLHVFKGFIVLLGNPLSHALLSDLLPKVGKCFQDTSENVRRVFVDMLMSIKSFRTIKFWKVTPPDEILHHLAEDKPPVARRVASLLFSSYHPVNKGDEMLLERSISLILANREAARRFYTYAHKYMDLNNSVHYILLVNKLLLGHLNSQVGNSTKDDSDEMLESINENSDESIQIDKICSLSVEVISGLLDAVCILWRSIKVDLDKDHNRKIKKQLHLEVARSFPLLFKSFKNSEVLDSILYLSSYLPASLVQMQKSFCMSRLRSGIFKNNENFNTLLECMCNWGHVDDVFDLISESLQLDISFVGKSSSVKAKKTCHKFVKFQAIQTLQPELALEYLKYIIQTPVCKNVVMNYRRDEAYDLLVHLRKIEEILSFRLSEDIEKPHFGTDEYLSSLFLRMCEVLILLHNVEAQPPVNAFDILSDIMEWIKLHVFPKLMVETPVDGRNVRKLASARVKRSLNTSLEKDELPKKIIERFLYVLWNVMTVFVVDVKFSSNIASFFQTLFDTGMPFLCEDGDTPLKVILRCFHQLQECCILNGALKSDLFNSYLPTLFQHWTRCLSKLGSVYNTSFEERFSSFKKPLLNILRTYEKCNVLGSKALDDIMSTLIVAILANVSDFISNVLKRSGNINELYLELSFFPDLSKLMLSVISSTATLMRRAIEELVKCMKSGIFDDSIRFAACLAILSAVARNYHFTDPILKEGVLLLSDLVNASSQSSKEKESREILEEVIEGLQDLKKFCGYAA